MRKLFFFLFLLIGGSVVAQTPVYPNPLAGICNPAVPHFMVNLNGTPDSVWVSPNVNRQPTCCGDPGTGNWTFVSFTVTLDPNVAEVAVGLAPSDPGGNSSGYWIDNCGTWGDRIEGGQEVCITGPGPHNFWYGKSGGNANSAYTIVQIPKPTFPGDDSVRIGCSLPLDIYGLNNITMTSGNATYDSWLDMTDPSHPVFTPGSTAPAFIDFTISGNQIASATCGNYVTTDVVRIYIYQPLDITVTPNPANFCEGGSVSLTASVTNPVGTLEYSWINNQTGVEISTNSSTPPISVAGNYTVYISDDLNRYGCAPVGITRYVSETLAPIVSAGADDTVCSTNPNAFLSATLTNPGTGVLWTSPSGGTFDDATSLYPVYTASATDLTIGFVDLTITAFGCQDDNDVVRIYFNNGPIYNVVTPAILCHDSTVTVSVNITSGSGAPWAPISYYWSVNGTSGPSSMELGAGTYSVTVVNSYGCGSNTPFTLTEPNILNLVMSNTDANPTGSATATISGGTPGYTYSWENSLGAPMGTTSTISGLATDYYVATVTDANGCFIVGSTVVNDPSCAGFDATALGTNVSCYDGKNGSATVISVVGGSGNYDYVWQTSPSQNNITATGLAAGIYEVVVTDLTLGCRDIAIAVVSSPSAMTNTMTHTDNTVIGGTAGTATANPAGGTPGYTYSWSTAPIQNTQTATGLAAGTYSVIITDVNGCSITDNVLINEPPCNNFQAAVITNEISCNGLTDGSAQVVIAHGTSPYTYSLDGGGFLPNPSGTFSGLTDGAHSLSIMDAQNCVVIQNFFISEPAALSIGLSPNNIICYGQTNGTIDLSVTGGTFPYTFDWINNNGNLHFATSEDVIGLGIGTYSVIVTDANGCAVTASTGISQPNEITATVSVSEISCYGDNNGAIDATVSGGQTPYTYSWIFPSGTANTQDLSGLSPGQYLLSITDANNCVKNNVVNIYMNEPQQVAIHSTIVNCPSPGASTTIVEVDSISGGTEGPYQLSFDGGAPLAAGVYSTSLTIGTTHTVIATDANGCTVTAPTSIVINPSVVISNIIFNPCIPAGATTIPVTVTPSGGDGGPYEVSTNNGGSFNPAGTYTINYPVGSADNFIIRDTSGCRSLPVLVSIPNEISVSSVVDSVACLNGNDGSILLSVSGGMAPYNVSWTGPLSGNPAGNEIIFSGGTYTMTLLTAGTYSITITDANNCTKVVSVVVGTTIDLINPTISCPGNITTNNDLNTCFANIIYGTPVGTDNCFGSITTQTAGLPSGSNFPVGTTTNSYLVTDAQGRTATCSFTITVIDAQIPTITCPVDVTFTADAGDCFADATSIVLGTPTTSDNCSVASVSNNAPVTYPVGTTPVTWTVVDVNGNSNSCTQNVIVTDDEFPVITSCPAAVNVNTDAGICIATNVSLGTPVATDNCGIASIVSDAPSTFPVGTTTVTWTVTDVNGNFVTCTQTVTVTDNQLPVIICDADINQSNDLGSCGSSTVTLNNPFTSDNCGIASLTNDAPAFFPVGTSTVTWTVTDVNGNSSQCTQEVTITDDENPTIIDCSMDFSINANPGVCFIPSNVITFPSLTVGDNCGTTTITNNIPVNLPVGITVITWTVTDASGNTATCQSQVTVIDNQLPVITTCPAAVNVNADNGSCIATNVNLGTPVATDNCGIASIVSDAPSTFPVGTTTVTWTVTDVNGNFVTCTQTVTVTDNQLPVIVCPANISQNNDLGICGSNTVTLGTPFTSDNCGVNLVSNDAPAFFPVGTTTVTWTVTDVNGNSAQCTQTVTIIDNELPVITTCPADINTTADLGNCFIDAANVNLGSPVVTDNCAVFTVTNDAPATFSVGTTTVTWTITDVNGNISTCEQDVTVTDDELPVITTCPAAVNVNADNGSCIATNVNLGTPVATDNCNVATIVSDAPSTFPVGTTTVTWTVTDVNGNFVTCTQTVTVTDNQLPVILCDADVTQSNDNGACGSASVILTNPFTIDNCGIASLTNDAPAFFPVGTTTVTWTVTDVNGNSAQCTQDVIIVDDENPSIITCQVDQTAFADASCGYALLDYTASILAADNCGYTITQSPVAGTIITTGITNVVITVTDNAGNFVSCNFNVVVFDTISPVITGCPSDILVSSDPGLCGAAVTWTIPAVTDNCGATMSSTHNSGDIFPVGTTTVTYTAADQVGNFTVCSFDITVTDNELPTIVTCSPNIGSCDSLVTFSAPTATDNCGIASITQTAGLSSGSIFPVGTTSNVYTITDVNGNSTTCTFDVTIHPTPELTLVTQNVSCNGFDNAAIDLTVISGTSPFSFVWSNGSFDEDLDSLSPGNYSVTVIDTFGCQAAINGTVTEPEVLTLSEEHISVDCYSNATGAIDLTVAGGTSPYMFNWSNGQTSEDISTLTSGIYLAIVTDSNGCIDSLSVEITQPDSMVVSSTMLPATCAAADGILDITVAGGTFPFSYDWGSGIVTEDLQGYPTGTYSVMITDAQGCTLQYTDSIGQVSYITIAYKVEDVLCNGTGTGIIDISVLNGTAPFVYSWSNGETTEDITGLSGGIYTVTVTDSNQCVTIMGFSISEPTALEVGITSPVDANGYNVSVYGGNNGAIDLTITGGTAPYSILWVETGDTLANLNALTAGTYNVVVTDANGCTVIDNITLTEPFELAMPTGYSPNGDGANDYFVVKGIEAFPDNQIQVYNRWGNIVYQESGYHNMWNGTNNSGEELPDGTYFVVLILNGTDMEPLTGYVDLRRTR